MKGARDCAAGCEARERYTDGLNCAQGVIGALSGAPGVPDVTESFGAGFTGGIGHSGCVCGALAGGVTVLGEYAKTAGLEPIATRALAEELSSELHERFTDRHKAACCRVIKRGQTEGSDEWLSGCADITEWTAATVADIVARHQGTAVRPRWAFRDALSTTRRVSLNVLAGAAVALAVAAIAPDVAWAGYLFLILAGGGVALEAGGPSGRRGGRVVRVAGGIAAAAVVVSMLFAPETMARALTLVIGDSAGALLARAVLALAVVAAAGTAAFGLKRYR
ncbi:MAG: hypothetical protein Kow0067_12560 [Coriobacteriia bacterium]